MPNMIEQPNVFSAPAVMKLALDSEQSMDVRSDRWYVVDLLYHDPISEHPSENDARKSLLTRSESFFDRNIVVSGQDLLDAMSEIIPLCAAGKYVLYQKYWGGTRGIKGSCATFEEADEWKGEWEWEMKLGIAEHVNLAIARPEDVIAQTSVALPILVPTTVQHFTTSCEPCGS